MDASFLQDMPVVQRPSEYFGALTIEKIDENELPDPKLT